MALSTVDGDGLPNVRMVLLKGFDERGFVFYTNQASQKGQELAARAAAGAVFHWKSLKRQVRLRGPVEQVAAMESDAYFATRARLSQIGAWASRQSSPLESRLAFEKSVAAATARFGARQRAAAAVLGRLPHHTPDHGVLAGPAVSTARPRRVSPRRAGRRLDQDSPVSVS